MLKRRDLKYLFIASVGILLTLAPIGAKLAGQLDPTFRIVRYAELDKDHENTCEKNSRDCFPEERVGLV